PCFRMRKETSPPQAIAAPLKEQAARAARRSRPAASSVRRHTAQAPIEQDGQETDQPPQARSTVRQNGPEASKEELHSQREFPRSQRDIPRNRHGQRGDSN